MAPGQALGRGLAVMGLAFVPLLLATALPVPEAGAGRWLLGGARRRRSPRCCWRWAR